MDEKRCNRCNKVLPRGCRGDLCQLCAVGLFPAEPVEVSVKHQAGIVVEGRQLSGRFCPGCYAELTIADLGLRTCAICGANLGATIHQLTVGKRRAELASGQRTRSRLPGEKTWPGDAPVR